MGSRRLSDNDHPAAFAAPVAAQQARHEDGKRLRTSTPRRAHATWEPAADRPDPIEVLVESNRTRVPELVPVRYERMSASPFAFLRGSALVMAHDLASVPRSGLQVRLCGDAHVANFGVFASPERRLVFDLNDFDEADDGPFEWDVKRLAASLAVAARESRIEPARRRAITIDAVDNYVSWMSSYARMSYLDVWYDRLDVAELLATVGPKARRRSERGVRKATTKNHLKALAKLTHEVDGVSRFIDDPPIIQRFDGPQVRMPLEHVIADYVESLSSDRRALFERYRFVDFARKVVGVGSVGTRCWIALFRGPNGGPLFMQIKEAGPSAPTRALGRPTSAHQGQRVVEGQRILQAAGDILLGWATEPETGVHYFVRQLWDAKGSVDVATLDADELSVYGRVCGRALAHAHARVGDSAIISGYVGTSSRFAESIADFAESYADQTERDHQALLAALAAGTLPHR